MQASKSSLKGFLPVPGDKSISHRAALLGMLAVGRTRLEGFLVSQDTLSTLSACRALGARVMRRGTVCEIDGVGLGGLKTPTVALECGNAGTLARLLMGIVASHPLTSLITGDSSLCRRPMERVIEPLSRMGARFFSSTGRLPLVVKGAEDVRPLRYVSPVPSAQVKSSLLLSGLMAPGETTVVEPLETRTHTERMLPHFGAHVTTGTDEKGAYYVTVSGQPELCGAHIIVPADISAAAFFIVATLVTKDSQVLLKNIGMNPLRTGFLRVLERMGADVTISSKPSQKGEPVADIGVRSSVLRGCHVPAEESPSMIDEYPIMAVAAAFAEGTSTFEGLSELRYKESDRLQGIVSGLEANGVSVESGPDWLRVHGGEVPGGGCVSASFDHRLVMSFLVMGLGSHSPVEVDDASPCLTSFPEFVHILQQGGARIEVASRSGH